MYVIASFVRFEMRWDGGGRTGLRYIWMYVYDLFSFLGALADANAGALCPMLNAHIHVHV